MIKLTTFLLVLLSVASEWRVQAESVGITRSNTVDNALISEDGTRKLRSYSNALNGHLPNRDLKGSKVLKTKAPKAPKKTKAPKAPKKTNAPKAPKKTKAPKASKDSGKGKGGTKKKHGKKKGGKRDLHEE